MAVDLVRQAEDDISSLQARLDLMELLRTHRFLSRKTIPVDEVFGPSEIAKEVETSLGEISQLDHDPATLARNERHIIGVHSL